ncbi:SGNH/GDSL hydrolase family protein [Iningainema tapete]|uniref:SGNH/GDSL hydrolase family protein n=1 Tax=Iningainema tapete BLCC-T55 TaxID=2748662 RepID=A0A8J7BZ01_9CYAN|nr:SGNH/GDSL hydrolase family protein [Iningainema tapete]MBD2776642.1 SGNH/GDSL hydrolase family protein [Iningainema tapete BLCC-T55]
MKKIILATASLLALIFPFEAKAATFDKIYVFGDSLSDTGNVFTVTTVANRLNPTIPVDPPSPPYFNGRYSNGPVWVDYLANSLGSTLTPSTNLAVGSPITLTPTGDLGVNFFFNGATTTQGVNFAFGGATSGLNNASDPRLPGVLREVQAFTNDLTLANQPADPQALYVVWAAGSNDYSSGNLNSTIFAENISQGVTSLFDVGARNILVVNVPDLGQTPRARRIGDANARTQVSQEFNASLTTTLNNLSQTLPGINLIPFDVNSIFAEAIANPTRFGFTNVTEPCLNTVNFTICSNPNEYLFWDDIHPTTVTHRFLGELVFERLASKPQSVPEPASTVSLGMVMLLWMLRNRQVKSKM